MKIKLLVSGLGGSLFPYLHEKLKDKFELFYVDGDEQLKHLYKDFNFFLSPMVKNPSYWEFIKKIIDECKIDFYIPLIDEEIVNAKTKIEGYHGVRVIAPSAEFSELCLNKFDLMRFLQKNEISNVESYTANNYKGEIGMPVFVKPISGRGSRGIKKIENIEELKAYYLLEGYEQSDILIQPLLYGTEYTVGVLTNNLNDFISISCKKIIRKKGITQIAVTENNDIIESVAIKIIEQMNPCGPINIQLMLTPENEVKIFEINPRFSTTTILEVEGGINPVSLYIENFGKAYADGILKPATNLVIHRRWENVFYGV